MTADCHNTPQHNLHAEQAGNAGHCPSRALSSPPWRRLGHFFATTVFVSFALNESWEMSQMSAYVETAGHAWTSTLGVCTMAAVGDVGMNDTSAATHILVCSVVGWSQRNERGFVMNHTDRWMNGWMGGGMWLSTVIGVLVIVLLVVAINKLSRR